MAPPLPQTQYGRIKFALSTTIIYNLYNVYSLYSLYSNYHLSPCNKKPYRLLHNFVIATITKQPPTHP
ncbi:MAG: hypothetical protein ACI30J_02085 [Paludibacteraceae bacterium]